MCQSLFSSCGVKNNWWLTTERFDKFALIVFRRMLDFVGAAVYLKAVDTVGNYSK